MLAFRAVTNKPLSYFLDNQRVIEAEAIGDTDPNYGVRMTEGDKYTTEDIRSTCNLVTHHDSWDWSALAYKVSTNFISSLKYFFSFFTLQAYITLLFIRCLQKADYFGENQSKDMNLGKNKK